MTDDEVIKALISSIRILAENQKVMSETVLAQSQTILALSKRVDRYESVLGPRLVTSNE